MRLLHPLLVLAFLWTASTSARAQVPPSIIVTVDYQARPGQGDALHAALGPLLAEVRKEPHFAGITVLRDPQGDPDRILLVEQWTDRAYYTGAHGRTAHLDAFKAVAMPLLAGPPAVALWPIAEQVDKP